MELKTILTIAISIGLFSNLLAQNRVSIEPFYQQDFKLKVKFEMNFPYKCKVVHRRIKRSNVPGFVVYELIAKDKQHKPMVYINILKGGIDYYIEVYHNSDFEVEEIDNMGMFIVKSKSQSFGEKSHVILIKEFDVKSNVYILQLTIEGYDDDVLNQLPSLKTCFNEFIITLSE